MFDNRQGDADHPLKSWGRKHPRLALWTMGAVIGVLILAAVVSAHRPGLLMITPGKTPSPLAQAAFEDLTKAVQADAAKFLAQTSAATRQAEARG
ncbi:MAG: hypothetical protein JO303_15495 [Caulobacteraceae bacterium]|nr:hypothetical protein [Caulobacteraceae bacterium]